MNNRDFTTKWGQFTSGNQLTEEETLGMEQLVESDAVLRAEIAEDHQLHRMLKSLGSIHESQEEFVSGVMAACTGVDNPVAQLLETNAPQKPLAWPWKLSAGWLVLTIPCVLLFGVYLVLRSQVDAAQTQAEIAIRAAERAEKKADQMTVAVVEEPAVVERSPVEPLSTPDVAPLASLPEPPRREPVSATPVNVVATITGHAPCVWAKPPTSKQLAAGEYELLKGETIVRTPGGSTVSIMAPARFELHHAAGMTLHRGNIEVQVAANDIGFRVTTPNSRIIDLGTRFSVSLNAEGRTRVRLDTGEVVVMPRQSSSSQTRHYLRVGQYEEAVVRGGTTDPTGLWGSHRSGPAGFEGTISLGGDTHQLGSLERFDHVYNGVVEQFADHPEETRVAWLELQKVLERVSVTATLGDAEKSFEGLDGVVRLEELIANPGSSLNGLTPGNVQVRGNLVVAGRRYPFRSVHQYEQARNRALGVLKQLGLESMATAQEARDRNTNPFESLRKSRSVRPQQ